MSGQKRQDVCVFNTNVSIKYNLEKKIRSRIINSIYRVFFSCYLLAWLRKIHVDGILFLDTTKWLYPTEHLINMNVYMLHVHGIKRFFFMDRSQQGVFGKTISSCHSLKDTVGVQINEMTFLHIHSSFFFSIYWVQFMHKVKILLILSDFCTSSVELRYTFYHW